MATRGEAFSAASRLAATAAGLCGAWPGALRRTRLRGGGRRLAGLLLRLLLFLLLGLQLLLPRLLLRRGVKKLPRNQHHSRERDGENGIFIIGHPNAVLSLRPACTRRSAPSKSSAIRANGSLERRAPAN